MKNRNHIWYAALFSHMLCCNNKNWTQELKFLMYSGRQIIITLLNLLMLVFYTQVIPQTYCSWRLKWKCMGKGNVKAISSCHTAMSVPSLRVENKHIGKEIEGLGQLWFCETLLCVKNLALLQELEYERCQSVCVWSRNVYRFAKQSFY